MAEDDVINCLKKTKKWLTVKDIHEKIKTPNRTNIRKHLNKLYKSREVVMKEEKLGRFRRLNYFKWRI